MVFPRLAECEKDIHWQEKLLPVRYKSFRFRKVERSYSGNPDGMKTETLWAIHESKYLSDDSTAEGESLTITQVLAYTLRYGRWVP